MAEVACGHGLDIPGQNDKLSNLTKGNGLEQDVEGWPGHGANATQGCEIMDDRMRDRRMDRDGDGRRESLRGWR
jgi:hypothetical protein